MFAGGATGVGSTGDGGNIIAVTGTSVGGDAGSLLLGTGGGQTSHIVSTGMAPMLTGSGTLSVASTDNCGTVTGIATVSTATITFHTPFPTGSLVNVVVTRVGAPMAPGSFPFLAAAPSTTGFAVTNPDTMIADITYIVMANV